VTLELEAIAGLRASLDSTADEMRQGRAMRQRELDALPIPFTAKYAGSLAAGGTFALTPIGNSGPRQGRMWFIRRIIMGGVAWNTAASGEAMLFATGLPPSLATSALPLDELLDASTTMPWRQTYSNEQLAVWPNMNVVPVIQGATAGQQYVAVVAGVDVLYDAAIRQVIET
jgi:hypothetical protein